MSTRSIVVLISSMVALVGFWGACVPSGRLKDSGITEALSNEAIMFAAGAPQGATFFSPSAGHGWVDTAVFSSRDIRVLKFSGTLGQLVAAFRGEVRRKIQSMGGAIHSNDVSGSENDVRSFHFAYSWRGNMGFIRVFSYVDMKEHAEISVHCYEHRR